MSYGKTPHYLVDLDLDIISDLGVGNKYHKSFNSGNAVAFAGNVFNFNIILFSNSYWCSWSGSAMEDPSSLLNKSSPSFAKTTKQFYAIPTLAIRLLNPFAHYYPKRVYNMRIGCCSSEKEHDFSDAESSYAIEQQPISFQRFQLAFMDSLQRYREIVPNFDQFIRVQSLPLPATARINTLKMDGQRLRERLDEEGISYQTFRWYPLGLKLDMESPGKLLENLLGYIHIQEELSMVPPLVLDPQPGEQVLDLCASPGSKTCQISQMMENRGLVIANEPSLARVAPLRSNCERLGVMNVAVTRYDGRKFPHVPFDRILVDAPCSSEGRERKGPGVLARSSCKRSTGFAGTADRPLEECFAADKAWWSGCLLHLHLCSRGERIGGGKCA